MIFNEIKCPICKLDIHLLSEIKRDEHCDACLDNADFLEPQNFTEKGKNESPIIEHKEKIPKVFSNEKDGESLSSVDETSISIHAATKPTKSINDSLPGALSAAKKRKVSDIEFVEVKSEVSNSSAVVEELREVPARTPRKPIPFYKILKFDSTSIAVDAFSYGAIPNVKSYFLTHFHSDHYGGLSKSWKNGVIYCSSATARLVHLKLKVPWEYLRPLELETEYNIENIDVKLFDANHCPGAVVFIFNKSILHTGDFRATNSLTQQLLDYSPKLDTVYLDTTYLDPNRAFPDQDSVVNACVKYCLDVQSKPMTRNFFTKTPSERKILVCVGTYTIGKERLAIAIAEVLNKKIWADSAKVPVLKAIGDPSINSLLCNDGTVAQVHLCPMRELNAKSLETRWKYLKKHFTHMIAFIPTGWTWKSNDTSFTPETLQNPKCTAMINNGIIRICSVPYSEHSSYSELEQFCNRISCKNLISTVYTKRYDILRSWERKGK